MINPHQVSFHYSDLSLSGAVELSCWRGNVAVQANTEEELPEHLLGTVQLSNLDMHKTVSAP